jgi:hypothetical protein
LKTGCARLQGITHESEILKLGAIFLQIYVAVEAMPANTYQVRVIPAQTLQIMGRKGRVCPLGVPGLHLTVAKAKGTTQDVTNRAAGSFINMDKYKHQVPPKKLQSPDSNVLPT